MTLPAVEPIMGQAFRFQVRSRSDPSKVHIVDWLAQPPSCSCNHYAMKNREHMQREGVHLVCEHMRQAKEHCWSELLEHCREQILAQ